MTFTCHTYFMPHHHSKIETLGLLLGLLFNHYPHQCPCSHCRCRCHQRRTTQTITEKPYPKYQFQSHQAERKLDSKTNNRVQNSINQSPPSLKTPESLYEHHTHFKASTKSFYTFYTPKSTKSTKRQDLREEDLSISVFRFDSNRNIDIERPKKSRRDQKRGKQTFWYCMECEKRVCKEGNCWSKTHK